METYDRLGHPNDQLPGKLPLRLFPSRASTERSGKELLELPHESGRLPVRLLFFRESTCIMTFGISMQWRPFQNIASSGHLGCRGTGNADFYPSISHKKSYHRQRRHYTILLLSMGTASCSSKATLPPLLDLNLSGLILTLDNQDLLHLYTCSLCSASELASSGVRLPFSLLLPRFSTVSCGNAPALP